LVIDLINEIKDIIKDQINQRFTEYLSVLRYEKRRHRALNEGVSGNRAQIERLNKGEKYAFALSLGTYTEGDGPTLESSDLKVTYGLKDKEHYSFSQSPEGGIGDYVVATEKFKRVDDIDKDKDGYMVNVPYYIFDDEGKYKYVAYERERGKYAVVYIEKDTNINLPFYEDENGTCVCIKSGDNRRYENYALSGGTWETWRESHRDKQVLQKNGKFKAAKRLSEEEIKKYRQAGYYEDKDGENPKLFNLNPNLKQGKYKKDLKPSNS
jgi:hypothetical protein